MIRLAVLVFACAFALATSAAAAKVGEDGLHKEDWFAITFRDIGEDIAAAKAQNKRLAIVFEQRGCIYCRKMHEDLLTDPEVRDFIKANFVVVQYNMFGDEEVTDLDGTKLTEKTAAKRWGYVFTPTIVFLPDEVPTGKTVGEAAVATMPGAFGKWTFFDMFRWVHEKGYEGEEHFQVYHARHINELRAQGRIK